jgi:hypothetical protein
MKPVKKLTGISEEVCALGAGRDLRLHSGLPGTAGSAPVGRG